MSEGRRRAGLAQVWLLLSRKRFVIEDARPMRPERLTGARRRRLRMAGIRVGLEILSTKHYGSPSSSRPNGSASGKTNRRSPR